MAQNPSADLIAREAGNSPRIIYKNYLHTVSAEQAAQWFAVMPGEASEKITYLKTAAL
jgi:hypothetical protein